jgi:hypothetical protein
MRGLKVSTGITVPIGPLASTTDATAYTSALAAGDVRLKKNDGSWAAATNAPSHEENGYYEITLTTTETNTLGELTLAVAKTGVLPYSNVFNVMDANTYAALVACTDYLDTNPGRFSISSTTLSLKNRSGTETATRTITSSASAEPITGLS